MLEAMKSVRDEMQSMKKSAKKVELDHSSTSASKPGPIKQSDNLPRNIPANTLLSKQNFLKMGILLRYNSLPCGT